MPLGFPNGNWEEGEGGRSWPYTERKNFPARTASPRTADPWHNDVRDVQSVTALLECPLSFTILRIDALHVFTGLDHSDWSAYRRQLTGSVNDEVIFLQEGHGVTMIFTSGSANISRSLNVVVEHVRGDFSTTTNISLNIFSYKLDPQRSTYVVQCWNSIDGHNVLICDILWKRSNHPFF